MTQAAVVKRKYTYQDYLQTPDDQRYELIEGELFMTPAPKIWHPDKFAPWRADIIISGIVWGEQKNRRWRRPRKLFRGTSLSPVVMRTKAGEVRPWPVCCFAGSSVSSSALRSVSVSFSAKVFHKNACSSVP